MTASEPGIPPGRPGPPPTTPVGELLTRWRHAAGLTQAELARRAAVSERALRELERGGTGRPRASSLRALADALGLDHGQRRRLLAAGRPGIGSAPPGAPPATRLGPLFGREAELGALLAALRRGPQRLVTVTGPGGVGKTRLAARAAAVLERRTDLAVQSLDVGALDDAAALVEVVADAVGARGRSRLDPVARVAATLGDQRLVLLLDGFERVRAAAPALRELVARCPGLTLLVTSRVPLLVGDEHELPLGPLPVPEVGDDLAAVAAVPAMALLLHVGATVRPGLALSPDTVGPLVAVCRAVDGLPLALELAAARLRLLAPAELAARLDRPLAVLADGPSTLPERHRSLRATIAASLELVGPEAAELLVRLAPFPAGVGLPDLEAVLGAGGVDRARLLRGLGDLAVAGLLRVIGGGGGSRYRLPDPVHELTVELLDGRADAEAIRSATARHYLRRLAEAGGRAGGVDLPGLRADEENIRAGLLWTAAHDPGRTDRAVVDAFYRLCELGGRFHQGRAVLVRLADAGGPGAPWAALRAAGLSSFLGEPAEAERLAARAAREFDPADDRGRAAVHLLLGSLAADRGDLDAGAEHATVAARASEAVGDPAGVGRAHNNIAAARAYQGRPDLALEHLRRALDAKRQAGESEVDLGRTLMNLAELELQVGALTEARIHGAAAADLLGRGGHPRLQAVSLTTVALAHVLDEARPDPDAARAAAGRAAGLLTGFGEDDAMRGLVRARVGLVRHAGQPTAEIAAEIADSLAAMLDGHGRREVPHTVEVLAWLAAGTHPDPAAGLLGFAAGLRTALGIREPGSVAAGRAGRRLVGRSAAVRLGTTLAATDPLGGLRALVADVTAGAAPAAARGSAGRA